MGELKNSKNEIWIGTEKFVPFLTEEEIQKRKSLIDRLKILNKKGVSSLEFQKQLACI